MSLGKRKSVEVELRMQKPPGSSYRRGGLTTKTEKNSPVNLKEEGGGSSPCR